MRILKTEGERNLQIHVSISPAAREMLRALAKSNGLSMSCILELLIRQQALEHLIRPQATRLRLQLPESEQGEEGEK